MRKLLALLLLLPLIAHAGSITGNIQTASSGAVVNGTLTFTLNQFAVVSGTAQVVATGVNCYTSTGGAITGEPDPQTAPVLSVNLGSGTLAAGTYFVKYTYFDGTGESLPSPEASVTLVSQGTVIVAVPAIQPANATGWRVYISAATGTETRQSSQTGFAASYQQTAALSAGTALPGTNTSACSIRFTDEMIPSTTYYTVNMVNAQSSKIAGYPISQARFYGGTNGSVNVSSGWPVSIGGVIWPSPIVSTPNGNAGQSISGPLNYGTVGQTSTNTGNQVVNGNVSVGGTLGDGALIIDGTSGTTLTAALVLCPNPGTLILTTTLSVAANISVPSTCTLNFMRGGSLSIATGATVTFSSAPIAPDDATIFSLTGTGAVAGLTFTRPEWFGGTTSAAVLAAYNSCGTNGCRIQLRDLGAATEYDFSWSGTHATEITKTEIEIAGSGMAEYNSQTAPTGYTGGGTVVKGPIWVMSDPAAPANGFKIHDLSVDNINGVTGADGVFINNNFPSGSTNGPPYIESVRESNVRTLGRSASSVFHSFLCDNCDGAVFENTESIFNTFGLVMKGQRYRSSRHYGRGHGTACIYAKSDTLFGSSIDISISHAKCEKLAVAGDGAGLVVDSQLTADNVGIRVDDYVGRSLIFCMSLQGINDLVRDVSVSNFLCDSNTAGITIGGATGTSGITITNGTVKGSTGGDGIQLNATSGPVTNVAISNVIVSGNSTNGITNALGTGISLSNIRAFNNGGWGVQSTGSACVMGLTGSGNASGLLATTGLTSCTNGPLTLVNGALLSYGRIASVGSIPSCSVTGAGASATCTIGTGSTDSFGLIAIGAAGAGPAATGTLTITLTAALGTHSTSCLLLPANTGSATWNARATFFQSNTSTTVPVMTWDNNAVALVAASSYQLSYTCFGL